ncbi:MAG: type I glutamate--ammonia ligase [Anaerolineales bacterium]|nr:type I glutamate--ammonia ligase [Anaerolineales bacterium]
MSEELLKRVREDGVKFICLQFTDVTGGVKSVDIPASKLESVIGDGIFFDGSSIEGFARIQESDMMLVPDGETYAVLPWSQEERKRARIFCDVYTPSGTMFRGSPRNVLKMYLEKLDKKGWKYFVGSEPEFFLIKKNGPDSIHPVPYDIGGYFDFSARDDAQRVRAELMGALTKMGLEIEMGHHEVALGQHEIDFQFADALRTADNVVTMKYTVKALAVEAGLTATFMPKPIHGINGSGMHCHQSIADMEGNNLFFDANDEFHLSSMAYHFMAGQLHHARALAAVVAPTVNSYKRIVPGYEAPVYICWAQMNRSAMIRIPHAGVDKPMATRAELRFPDPSSNPYLAFTAMLAAGMDGIEKKMECPPPVNNINIFEMNDAELDELGIGQLPDSLGAALDEFEKDEVLKNALGPETVEAFLRAKRSEWENFTTHVTDWEVRQYLETA